MRTREPCCTVSAAGAGAGAADWAAEEACVADLTLEGAAADVTVENAWGHDEDGAVTSATAAGACAAAEPAAGDKWAC